MDPKLTDYVEQLHAVVDELSEGLVERHGARLRCGRGCAGCCADGLTIFEVEASVIRRHHPEVLRSEPAPPGGCAFLDAEGACRIYAHRPYVCRTQGLPLRWLEEQAGEIVERRDICPLNEAGGPPLDELPTDDCWALGPIEARLQAAQKAADGGEQRRVALRDLFGADEG